MKAYDVVVAGGGAAGFFAAINIAENHPDVRIAILERGKEVLSKVRISGGGRCNVTHACFDPKILASHYPRGERELRGPFHKFGPAETIAWFESKRVSLKTEDDGRMFPESDSSQTIIDCFLNAASDHNIDILTGHRIDSIFHSQQLWKVQTQHETFVCEKLVIASGSNPKMWELLETLGHSIVPAVPSLFTFNINDKRIANLPGIATPATVKVQGEKLWARGPLLITHWGMSGPGILKLSAWGARILADKNYKFSIEVNWLDELSTEETLGLLRDFKLRLAKRQVIGKSPFDAPMANRLWDSLVLASGIEAHTKWADVNKTQMHKLANELTRGQFQVDGKSTFKEEFVTAGGVDLREIDFKTMQSKKLPGVFLAGEVLNIDAITGGFNFQNAWTGGYLIGQHIF